MHTVVVVTGAADVVLLVEVVEGSEADVVDEVVKPVTDVAVVDVTVALVLAEVVRGNEILVRTRAVVLAVAVVAVAVAAEHELTSPSRLEGRHRQRTFIRHCCRWLLISDRGASDVSAFVRVQEVPLLESHYDL